MQENVQTNIKGKTLRSSRSQMFFKIVILKKFAELPRKHLCWSVFLIKKQAWRPAYLSKKKETTIQVFSCEYCEFFKSFFTEHLIILITHYANVVHYTFPKFYVMIEFFGSICVQNSYFSYFLYHCFVFLHDSIESVFHGTCFYNFRTHYKVRSSTILLESLKFRNNSRITVTFPSNLL